MYYSPDFVKSVLVNHSDFQEKLYVRGYLISEDSYDLTKYPFYANWEKKSLGKLKTFIYHHKKTNCYIYEDENTVYFLIGHAYDPYDMIFSEDDILRSLAKKMLISEDMFWEKSGDLTGVYTFGYINNNKLCFSTDSVGMSMTYYGIVNSKIIISSHSKIVADLYGLEQDPYIVKLVNSRFYRFFGMWLPGDLSPFAELKRLLPNFCGYYSDGKIITKRYFPKSPIIEITSEEEYYQKLDEIDRILQNSLFLISKKWSGKRAALSLTGGKDSTTTLSCAKDVYQSLGYFSYVSVEKERPDAEAAKIISDRLGLEHHVYYIPENDSEIANIDIHRMILECNAGCIGKNNDNDVRKRAFFSETNDFDVEIKSWVGELSRAEAQNKYNTLQWPAKPSAGYFRCMWKVIVSPTLILESNRVFREYLRLYYSEEVLSYLPWMDYFFWEFSWPAGEGLFLTSEHKYAYDVTIPYCNRHLLKTMFETPFAKRLKSKIQTDTIHFLEPRIEAAGQSVKNVTHTKLWEDIIRIYLHVFSVLNF